MSRQSRSFNAGRIRRAEYDSASRQLDLQWDDGTVRAYKHVPQEVWRRFCAAPNPTTYWEDRIAEEYPKGSPMGPAGAPPAGGRSLQDLFGEAGDD